MDSRTDNSGRRTPLPPTRLERIVIRNRDLTGELMHWTAPTGKDNGNDALGNAFGPRPTLAAGDA
jgi:hypothetical protein